jgi:hypothetical protein
MTATVDQVAQIRRMVGEPTTAIYSDAALTAMIEAYPLMDENGVLAYYWNYLTTPPSKVANTSWIPTYDLNQAAADIWQEKAATAAQDFDVAADGAAMSRSQVYEQCMKQQRHYAAKRAASTIRLRPSPRPLPGAFDEELD